MLLPTEEALNLAIFAVNTLLYPDASHPNDIAELEEKAEDVVETLADIRQTLQEIAS